MFKSCMSIGSFLHGSSIPACIPKHFTVLVVSNEPFELQKIWHAIAFMYGGREKDICLVLQLPIIIIPYQCKYRMCHYLNLYKSNDQFLRDD